MTALFSDATVVEARAALLSIVKERGGKADCPVCQRHTQIYWHPINKNMAKGLIALWQDHRRGWGDIQAVRIKHNLHRSKQETTIARWGLMEEEAVRRPDGGRAGFWRVTADGERWLKGEKNIPKYALLYDSKCLGHRGEYVSIHDALGMNFDYRSVMN